MAKPHRAVSDDVSSTALEKPVYRAGYPTSTTTQRRAAVRGVLRRTIQSFAASTG